MLIMLNYGQNQYQYTLSRTMIVLGSLYDASLLSVLYTSSHKQYICQTCLYVHILCGDKFANQAAMLVKGLEKCIAFVREIVCDT
jgi:hypothetical protein